MKCVQWNIQRINHKVRSGYSSVSCGWSDNMKLIKTFMLFVFPENNHFFNFVSKILWFFLE